MVELVGASAEAADAGQLAVVGGFDAVFGTGDFLVGGRVAVDVCQFGLYGGFDFVEVMALGGGDLHQ